MAGVTITDTDHGFRALRVAVRGASGAVTVGVDSKPHEPSGLPTDVLGAIHEFGLGHVPERSFLRAWVDENQNAIRLEIRKAVLATLEGGVPWKESLDEFGAWCVTGIRARIMRGIDPPVYIDTFKRKTGMHAEIPLVDTEQLIQAIMFELHDKVGA